MYNLQFKDAHRSFTNGDGIPTILWRRCRMRSAYLFSETDRLHIPQSEFFMHHDTSIKRWKTSSDPTVKQNLEMALENVAPRDTHSGTGAGQ